ncbi:hypothetical protein ABIA33_007147 [Streptacidiphilus sp. MAP12-16]|uniref:hypothetical protein n=1 Tax=Streptacidiphilus sp. MAP12-16 TaxID=3156300 RepID=UPI0035173DA8
MTASLYRSKSPNQLVHWGIAHQVSANVLTDALVFMAITMLVTRTRTLGLWARAAALPAAAAAESGTGADGSTRGVSTCP